MLLFLPELYKLPWCTALNWTTRANSHAHEITRRSGSWKFNCGQATASGHGGLKHNQSTWRHSSFSWHSSVAHCRMQSHDHARTGRKTRLQQIAALSSKYREILKIFCWSLMPVCAWHAGVFKATAINAIEVAWAPKEPKATSHLLDAGLAKSADHYCTNQNIASLAAPSAHNMSAWSKFSKLFDLIWNWDHLSIRTNG